MRNIQLIIEYDGTNYCGWQIQKNGITIQKMICDSIYKITGENCSLIGSGRTDAGVHAYAQSANFITESKVPINRFARALNSYLPKDIRIVNAIEKDLKFHSRYDAKGKIYEYRILNNLNGTALDNNRVWHITKKLDIDKIKEACKFFLGTHDFTSFSSVNSCAQNKVRNIGQLVVTSEEEYIRYKIKGNGFLYNMVRIIVGTLVEVGLSRIEPSTIPKIIQNRDRSTAGKTAPPQGLYLKEVLYK